MTNNQSHLNQFATTIGLAAGGLVLVLISAAIYEGVLFLPSVGKKYGPPRMWQTISFDSTSLQFVSAVSLFLAGSLLFLLAYRNYKQRGGQEK